MSEITPSTALTFQERFGKEIDVEEFKRKAIQLVLESRVGRAPLDYYFAELAVQVWMDNYEKTAEELENFISSWELKKEEVEEEPEEGEISGVHNDEEDTVSSHPLPPPTPYKDALLRQVVENTVCSHPTPILPDELFDSVPSTPKASP